MDKKEVNDIKRANIIDMAIGFTVMLRVCEKGSIVSVRQRLSEILLDRLPSVDKEEQLSAIHVEFCNWFSENIKRAKKYELTSYGHAAKIMDLVLKVYVYYCNEPNHDKAKMLLPWINSGIDNPILRHLVSKFLKGGGYKRNDVYSILPTSYKFMLENKVSNEILLGSFFNNIGQITGKEFYDFLQKLIRIDIAESFDNGILPVQYDDIMWRRLNRDNDE